MHHVNPPHKDQAIETLSGILDCCRERPWTEHCNTLIVQLAVWKVTCIHIFSMIFRSVDMCFIERIILIPLYKITYNREHFTSKHVSLIIFRRLILFLCLRGSIRQLWTLCFILDIRTQVFWMRFQCTLSAIFLASRNCTIIYNDGNRVRSVRSPLSIVFRATARKRRLSLQPTVQQQIVRRTYRYK